ncbi:MAG TPA: hypothetical protein VFE05_19075 [Longimicrobiaceae bacterium]|jgi:hypothetical protein|nr:hypothetical protein [Longimicrobiaceae bacterium]
MRNNSYQGARTVDLNKTTPSQYQVKEITGRGLPVPPTYAEAQALLDSFPPTDAQQRRLEEIGLEAGTRGEAKGVLAQYVAANPEVGASWEAQAAEGRVTRRQERRGGEDPRVTTPGMFKLLAESGVTNIPSDFATAAALIDALPPSEGMAQVLRDSGRAVPETRAAASEIIRTLPATPDQIVTIMRATGGRYAPKSRGDAQSWFANNRQTRSNNAYAGSAPEEMAA